MESIGNNSGPVIPVKTPKSNRSKNHKDSENWDPNFGSPNAKLSNSAVLESAKYPQNSAPRNPNPVQSPSPLNKIREPDSSGVVCKCKINCCKSHKCPTVAYEILRASQEDFVFDYKKWIEEDPWNYDTIEVDEEELKRRHPLANFVSKKPRTLRYVVGEIICYGGKDLIYYVAKREESRKSEQLPRGKDLSYYPGSSMIRKNEELRKSKKQLCFADDEDAGPSNGIGMITKKEAARKSKRSARVPNYICWEDDEEPSKKKQKRNNVPKKKQQDNVPQGPPPELPDRFRDYVDKLNLAEPPLFVAQKPFTATDLDRHQSRLSFPRARIEDKFFEYFLTDVENQMLENKKRIEVNVVDDNIHVYDTLQFTRWPMKSKNSKSKNSIYVLTKDWNRFAADHRLKENMVVQCWCFRMDSRICFCLAVNRDIEKEK